MFIDAQNRAPNRASVTLLIAKRSPSVYNGLMAALLALPNCEVQSWRHDASDWTRTSFDRDFDIVIGDKELIADASRSASAHEWHRLMSDLHPAIVVVSGPGRQLLGREKAATASGAGGLTPRTLERVKDHLEEDLSKPLDLLNLSLMASLSVSHFSRAFKRSLGIPPHRYLLSRRLAVAAELIPRSDRSLTDIALDLGFSDQSHFTRMFSRAHGETPGAYRRRNAMPGTLSLPSRGGCRPSCLHGKMLQTVRP